MTIDRNKIATLLIVWAFFIGLIGLGLTVPTVLLIIGTILFLL